MYFLEIFRKRRSYEPLFKNLWGRISPALAYPEIGESDQRHKLIYVGLLAYAAVFSAARAAEMSSSAAHYLARTQLRQYRFDKLTARSVEQLFSGTDEAREQAYAGQLLQAMDRLLAAKEIPPEEVAALMQNLARDYVAPGP